jgi:hypothetical protein
VPLHLLASVCLLILNLSATSVYKSCSPSSCASIAATAASIGSILVELSRVQVGVSLVFWCSAERHAGPSATAIYTVCRCQPPAHDDLVFRRLQMPVRQLHNNMKWHLDCYKCLYTRQWNVLRSMSPSRTYYALSAVHGLTRYYRMNSR